MVLERFSSKFKRRKFRDENEHGNGSGNKKRRPNWDRQRSMKLKQYEDQEDEQ